MRVLHVYKNSFRGLSQEAWMLAAVMLINRSGSMVLPFLGVYMTDHLHFTLKASGIVLSFYGIGSVIGSWLGGYITDKVGEFKVQTASLFLSAPLFCLLPLFKSVEGLSAIILIQSIITESFRPANSVAITRYAKPENLTRAFSLNRMAINLGFSIGPALGGVLAAISNNFLFVVNAIGALIAGIVYVRFFNKRRPVKASKLKKDAANNEMKHLVKERSVYTDLPFLVYCFFCAIFSICFFQFFSTLPIFYKEEAHLSPAAIGYILGYSGFIIVLMEMILVNSAEKYIRVSTTLFIGTFCCAISYAMLAINHTIILLVFSMTVLCVGEILVLPFMSAITALRAGKSNAGVYMGLNGMSISIAFIITPYLGTNVASDFGFNKLWLSTGIILLVTAFAFYRIVNRMMPKKAKQSSTSISTI